MLEKCQQDSPQDLSSHTPCWGISETKPKGRDNTLCWMKEKFYLDRLLRIQIYHLGKSSVTVFDLIKTPHILRKLTSLSSLLVTVAPPFVLDRLVCHSGNSHLSLSPNVPMLENWPITGQSFTVDASGPCCCSTWSTSQGHVCLKPILNWDLLGANQLTCFCR